MFCMLTKTKVIVVTIMLISRCKWIMGGLYSCRWRTERNHYHQSERTTKCEIAFFVILTLIFLLSITWLYTVAVFANDSFNINVFLYELLGFWFPWFLLILVLSVVVMAYLLILVIIGLFKILKRSLHLFICHKLFIFICFAFIVAGYVVIGIFYPLVWLSVTTSFETTGIFLQLFSVIIWTLFSIYISYFLKRFSNLNLKVSAYILYFVIFIFLLTIPIWILSPCIGPNASNQPKPLLFGHRGAPTLAPENTNLSFEKAITDCGVSVLESDVRVSSDGILFMFHDDNLIRTTNVAEVFPERKNNRPESFTWAELQELNAGNWFLQTNPFLSVGALTEREKNLARTQKIPALIDYLNIAAVGNVSVMFDLFHPPYNHNYRDFWINLTLEVISQSNLPQQQVLWLMIAETKDFIDRSNLKFRYVSSSRPSQASVDSGVTIFNLLYSSVTSSIISPSHSIIAYTINQNWAFSRAWCLGVWGVTTDKCNDFKNMVHPSWTLTQPLYLGVWISINLLCLISAIVIIAFFGKKSTSAVENNDNIGEVHENIFVNSETQNTLNIGEIHENIVAHSDTQNTLNIEEVHENIVLNNDTQNTLNL